MMIDGNPNVFVRTPDGFIKREVELGRGDDDSVEVVSGLKPGEEIAVSNVFLLKAELGKQNIPEE
jgi:cobalt-zinc-cadmium efflux system membrane fusion protein